VLPGVEEVRARPRTPSKELIRLDLPKFERPRKAISGFRSRGQSASLNALFRNSADMTFIRQIPFGLITGRGSLGGGALLVERNQFRHAIAKSRQFGFVVGAAFHYLFVVSEKI